MLIDRFKKILLRLFYNIPLLPDQRTRLLRLYGVRIGENCHFLADWKAFGSEPYLIQIGDHCEIAEGVCFITHDGGTWVLRTRPDWHDTINRFGKIIVGDNCFIGLGSIILPGVTIGPNAIVGAGSVVTRDVPPNAIVAGVPARVIGDIETYARKCIDQAIPGVHYKSSKSRQELVERL